MEGREAAEGEELLSRSLSLFGEITPMK